MGYIIEPWFSNTTRNQNPPGVSSKHRCPGSEAILAVCNLTGITEGAIRPAWRNIGRKVSVTTLRLSQWKTILTFIF